jgi:hypothetical protein
VWITKDEDSPEYPLGDSINASYARPDLLFHFDVGRHGSFLLNQRVKTSLRAYFIAE